MQMLLKLMHSSVKNVFDRSHNLIGMLLTYVLQDNKLQVGQWVASTQSPQPPPSPPLPHTDLFFSPRPRLASFAPRFPLTPQPSWEPVRRLSLNGCDIFKLYLDLIQCSKFCCRLLSFYNDANKAVCCTLPWQPNKFNQLAIVAPGTVEQTLMLLGLM